MYSAHPDKIVMNKRTRIQARDPLGARGGQAGAYLPQPTPIQWAGSWAPKTLRRVNTLGALRDDDLSPLVPSSPVDFPSILDVASPSYGAGLSQSPYIPIAASLPAPSPVSPSSGSIWDTLAGGLSSIVKTVVGGAVTQQQQKTMAATWNPALTGPALLAQQYQNAYATGIGTSPAMTAGTLGLLAAGGLLLYAVFKRKD